MSNLNIILPHSSNLNAIKSNGPRALYTVGHSTVLDEQITSLNHIFNNPNIIVIAGFKYKKIRNHIKHYPNVSIVDNQLYENTNELYAINLGIDGLKDNVLIIENNTLPKKTTFAQFKRADSQLFISKTQKFELGCIIDTDGYISNISWGLPNYWANISFFKNQEFELLKNIAANKLSARWFLVEAINWIIKQQGKFSIKEIKSQLKIVNKINV